MSLIFLGRITQALLALVALRVMTGMLSPEEVGRWSLLLAVTSFFVLGLVNPVGMFINRRLHAWVEFGRIKRYMLYYIVYLCFVSLLAALLLYISSFVYEIVPNMEFTWLVLLVCGSVVFATLNQTYIPSLNLLGYRGWFVLLTLATVTTALVGSMLFVDWFKPTAEMWQLGQLVGQLLFALVGGGVFFHYAKKHKKNNSDESSNRITYAKLVLVFSFAWPLVLSVLFTWVQSQSYRFIVQDMIGLQLLGLFVVGYGVAASIIGVFESIISTYFIPSYYKRISSEDKDEHALAWREYASAMLVGLMLTIAVVIAVSDELAFVLLDASFSQAAQYIVWGALAEAARVIVATYALLAHAGMDTKKLIIPNALAALSAPILVFLLVGVWAAHGLGMGLAIAGCVAIIASHVMLSKSFKVMVPWQKIMQAALIALCFLVSAKVGHSLLGISVTFVSSFAWLFIAGMLLLCILYIMLNTQIHKEAV